MTNEKEIVQSIKATFESLIDELYNATLKREHPDMFRCAGLHSGFKQSGTYKKKFQMLYDILLILYKENPNFVNEPDYLVKLCLELDSYKSAFQNAELIYHNGNQAGYQLLFKQLEYMLDEYTCVTQENQNQILIGLNEGYKNNVIECGWYLFNQKKLFYKADPLASKRLEEYIDKSMELGGESRYSTNINSYRIFKLAQYFYYGDIVTEGVPVHPININLSFYWYLMALRFSKDEALRKAGDSFDKLSIALNNDSKLSEKKKDEITQKVNDDWYKFCGDVRQTSLDTYTDPHISEECDSTKSESLTIHYNNINLRKDSYQCVDAINNKELIEWSDLEKINIAILIKSIGKTSLMFRWSAKGKPKTEEYPFDEEENQSSKVLNKLNDLLKDFLGLDKKSENPFKWGGKGNSVTLNSRFTIKN